MNTTFSMLFLFKNLKQIFNTQKNFFLLNPLKFFMNNNFFSPFVNKLSEFY